MPVSALPLTRIAFFDVDKTILSVNSGARWIRRELRLGYLSPWQALRGSAWSLLYALRASTLDNLIASAVETLRGVDESAFHQRTCDFWREDVIHFVRPAARAAIAAHHASGARVLLLTSSSTHLTNELALFLGADGFLCNQMEVESGRFTGRLLRPLASAPARPPTPRPCCRTWRFPV